MVKNYKQIDTLALTFLICCVIFLEGYNYIYMQQQFWKYASLKVICYDYEIAKPFN